MLGKERMPKYWLPWLVGMPAETSLAICSMMFGGVFERFPKLRVAFAHGGGAFPFTIGRIEHAFHVRPDLVAVDNNINPRSYLANGGQTRAVLCRLARARPRCAEVAAQALRRAAGRARLGLPVPARRSTARQAHRIDERLPAQEKTQLLSGTAREFLGL